MRMTLEEVERRFPDRPKPVPLDVAAPGYPNCVRRDYSCSSVRGRWRRCGLAGHLRLGRTGFGDSTRARQTTRGPLHRSLAFTALSGCEGRAATPTCLTRAAAVRHRRRLCQPVSAAVGHAAAIHLPAPRCVGAAVIDAVFRQPFARPDPAHQCPPTGSGEESPVASALVVLTSHFRSQPVNQERSRHVEHNCLACRVKTGRIDTTGDLNPS